MPSVSNSWLRNVLGALCAFIALNAFAGGFYGLSGAEGIPREWLQGSPFKDYFIPSLFLFIVVGGAFAYAAVAVFARFRRDRTAAIVAAVIVLAWLVIQVSIIGYVSWMQPATTVAAILVITIALNLPKSGER